MNKPTPNYTDLSKNQIQEKKKAGQNNITLLSALPNAYLRDKSKTNREMRQQITLKSKGINPSKVASPIPVKR